jgi:NADH:ubiquinone oxidoreductase subunit 6 (subunit J)
VAVTIAAALCAVLSAFVACVGRGGRTGAAAVALLFWSVATACLNLGEGYLAAIAAVVGGTAVPLSLLASVSRGAEHRVERVPNVRRRAVLITVPALAASVLVLAVTPSSPGADSAVVRVQPSGAAEDIFARNAVAFGIASVAILAALVGASRLASKSSLDVDE